MKCISSFILLLLTCILSVVTARKEVGRPNIDGFYYACYDDGRATLTGTNQASYYSYIIPDYVTYQGKQYRVTIVQANAFNGSQFTKISVHSKNTALLLRRHALNGVKGLKEFNFNSLKVEPEIDAFDSVGTTTLFDGFGIPYALEKLSTRYLKKWKLPVGKNYQNNSEKMQDLFLLSKYIQREFTLNDNIAYPNKAATVALAKQGNRDGIARLYRIMAMVMGVPENEVLVGCDTRNYCWNYVYVYAKWYVMDVQYYIHEFVDFNSTYFMKESYFINYTLKAFYGSTNNIIPSQFVVHRDVYNYYGENQYNKNMKFDEWIRQNKTNGRTLN